MNKYISDLIYFIESIDINKDLLSHENCEIYGDKSKVISTHYISSSQPRKYSFSINQTAIFMLLDAYVDSLHPNLMNEGFKYKYKKLPESNNCEKIIKGIFRILRIVRNALIHEVDALNAKIDTVNITRKKGSKESLRIRRKAINTLNFIVWYCVKNDLSVYYNELVLVTAYNRLVNGIIQIEDESGSDVLPVQSDITLKSFRRYKVTGMKVEELNGKLILQRKEFLIDFTDDITGIEHKDVTYACSDYLFDIGEKTYFVPDECLTVSNDKKTGCLPLKDVCKFETNHRVANTGNLVQPH